MVSLAGSVSIPAVKIAARQNLTFQAQSGSSGADADSLSHPSRLLLSKIPARRLDAQHLSMPDSEKLLHRQSVPENAHQQQHSSNTQHTYACYVITAESDMQQLYACNAVTHVKNRLSMILPRKEACCMKHTHASCHICRQSCLYQS